MLSEEEKQELKALVKSSALRRDFEMLRALARRYSQECPIEQYLVFLSSFFRVVGYPTPPRPFPLYTNVRL